MAGSTREQLLQTSQKLFAHRGFEGVSIAQIAEAHGLTKQALLHHFKSKEKLYGEVLQRIAEDLLKRREDAEIPGDDPAAQLQSLLMAIMPQDEEGNERMRLIMRELLDNQQRADKAGAWYLKPLLEDFIAMTKRLPEWGKASEAEALALVYQLFGAVNYYAISGPTLRGIFGEEGAAALEACYPERLKALMSAAFACPPR